MVFYSLYAGKKRHRYIIFDINGEGKYKQKKNWKQYFYGLIEILIVIFI